MKIENYQKDALKIDGLNDNPQYETKETLLFRAKSIFKMYNEDGNVYSDELNWYGNTEKDKQIRLAARKHITQLKKYIKKYDI